MKKILLISIVVLVIASVLISGCNQPKDNTKIIPIKEEGGGLPPTAVINVIIKNSAFIPEIITVKKGQNVTWTNSDNFAHTVTSITGEFDSGPIEPGKEFKYKFDVAGPFEYSCTIHPSMIHGKINVT